MGTLTQQVYASIKEHLNTLINDSHEAFIDDIVALRNIVGDLKKDIRKGQNTLDVKIRELSERLEDTDNAIGVLNRKIKDMGKEITEVDN